MVDLYDQWPDPRSTDQVTEEMYGFIDHENKTYDHEGLIERLGEIGLFPDTLTSEAIFDQAVQILHNYERD